MKLFFLLFISLSCLFSKAVRVDDLLTSKNEWRINFSLNYNNVQRKITAPIFVSPGMLIPGTQENNQDLLGFGFGARYGIFKNLQILANIDGLYQHNKTFNVTSRELVSKHHFDFGTFNMGFVYKMLQEDQYPSLLIGADLQAINRTILDDTHKSFQYLKSYSFSLTSFYTVDPVVFFVQANFRANLNKKDGDFNFNAGEVFTLSPLVYFAINPYISMNWGMRYRFQTRDTLNHQIITPPGSSLGYVFGLTYEIKDGLLVLFDAELLDTNTFNNKSFALTFSYGF